MQDASITNFGERMRPLILFLSLVILAETSVAQDQQFSKYLVPISIGGQQRGAAGAVWNDVFTVLNDSSTTLRFGPDLRPGMLCDLGPCILDVPPGTAFNMALPLPSPRPVPAIIYYVRREVSSDVSLSARLLPNVVDSLGVQIPIISESEFRIRPAHLLIVSSSEDRYRTLLRLYDPDSVPGTMLRVRAYHLFTGALLADRVMTLSVPPQPVPETPFYPGYAQVAIDQSFFLDAEVRPGTPLRLKIESLTPGQRFWAMASMTSNSTNAVTLITPEP